MQRKPTWAHSQEAGWGHQMLKQGEGIPTEWVPATGNRSCGQGGRVVRRKRGLTTVWGRRARGVTVSTTALLSVIFAVAGVRLVAVVASFILFLWMLRFHCLYVFWPSVGVPITGLRVLLR